MAGNSWLGVAQWVTAAEQPPSLKCIAPFEGASDIYREIICRGGIPYSAFFEWVAGTLRGEAERPLFLIFVLTKLFQGVASKRTLQE
jgi:predicted acyl esterase